MTTDAIKVLPATWRLVSSDRWKIGKIRQHETYDGVAFTAEVKLDGKLVGSLENDGRGGETMFRPFIADRYRELNELWAEFDKATQALQPPHQLECEDGQIIDLPGLEAAEVLMQEAELLGSIKRARKGTRFYTDDPGDGLIDIGRIFKTRFKDGREITNADLAKIKAGMLAWTDGAWVKL